MKNKDLYVNFPESLRVLPQWVLWKFESRDGKTTKVPYQPNGKHAAVNRPQEWSTFEECHAAVKSYDGLGFIFTEGVVGIDLDKCFELDGTLKSFAQEALVAVDSYTELSPSGNGLHIILKSDIPLAGRKNSGIECYSTGRFFTVTGNVYQGRNELKSCDVSTWYGSVFKEQPSKSMPELKHTGYLPEDGKILRVMFKSKGGKRCQALYETGNWKTEGYGSQSEADLALVGSLMFYCRNNTSVVDRLFRQSKLMREKWDEKHGATTYGEMTMQLAMKSEVMEWETPKQTENAEVELLMSDGRNPVPLLVTENVCRVLEQDEIFCATFRLNDFSHMIEAWRDSAWGTLQEIDILEAQKYISSNWHFLAKISKEMTIDAIRYIAHKTRINPPADYLRSLIWDEVPRLDFWLHVTFGTPNDELHEKMGANWLKGLVQRVLHPGCQFDQVLVLEGAQGWRKSTALRVLGAPWHVESTLSTEDRDFYMLLASSVVVEFSEGEIVGRTSARRLKAIITKTEDRYRAPYERGMQTFKRGCVFAMTTNDDDYQKDETGGRRWLPVVLTRVADIDWLRTNRDQLFAEAVYRVETLKETTYEYPQTELMALQEEKNEEDDYTEDVVRWYTHLTDYEKNEGVTPLMAYKGAVDGTKVEIHRDIGWRIRKVLKSVLKLESRSKKIEGKVLRRWFPRKI